MSVNYDKDILESNVNKKLLAAAAADILFLLNLLGFNGQGTKVVTKGL